MAVSATLLAACGGGSSGDSATVDSDGNQMGAGGSSVAPFFNPDSGIGFANELGESMSRVFNAASGSVGESLVVEPTEDSRYSARAIEKDSLPCDTGSLDSAIDIDDQSGELNGISLNFNECNSGGSVATGSMAVTISGTLENQQFNVSFDNFSSSSAADGTSSINGMINASSSQNGDTSTVSISGSSLSMGNDEEQITFNDYALTAIDSEASGASMLSGYVEIVSSVDGTIDVSINPPLNIASETDDYPVSGGIVMTHSDGSSLSMNADNGDPASFDYTITADGATTSGVERWDNTDFLMD